MEMHGIFLVDSDRVEKNPNSDSTSPSFYIQEIFISKLGDWHAALSNP